MTVSGLFNIMGKHNDLSLHNGQGEAGPSDSGAPGILAALGPRSLWGEQWSRLASSWLCCGAGVAGRCKAWGCGMGVTAHVSTCSLIIIWNKTKPNKFFLWERKIICFYLSSTCNLPASARTDGAMQYAVRGGIYLSDMTLLLEIG